MVEDEDLNKALKYFYGINKKQKKKRAIELIFENNSKYGEVMQDLLNNQFEKAENQCKLIINEESDVKHAIFILGWLSEEGKGKEINLEESFRHYTRAG